MNKRTNGTPRAYDRGMTTTLLTLAQLRSLHIERRTSADWHGAAMMEAALAPSETTDEFGDLLRDERGEVITRSEGLAYAATLGELGVNEWYEQASRRDYSASRDELVALAARLDRAATETGLTSWADRARDCRFRAERAK
jgi:hypothetical protein